MKIIITEQQLKLLIENRLTIEQFNDTFVLLITENNDQILLYYKKDNIPIGYIMFYYDNDVNVYSVAGAYSKRGFGPFLYETVMTYVYPYGVTMSRESGTSDDAVSVWLKFDSRDDVKKERINSNIITNKRELFKKWGYDNPYYKKILEMEDTRYIYSYGKDRLNTLLNLGNKYKKENSITDDDIENMSISLEP